MNGIGIDFGTTNSVASVCDSRTNKVRAFTDLSNNLPHPSVVWYRGDGRIVGREAKHNIRGYASTPGNAFVSSVKRRLGQNHSYSILGEKKQAWQVAADILSHLKTQGQTDYAEEFDRAVITIPIYYDGRARSELRKAAGAAGIQVTTFVHEPFAAVVGFCQGKGGVEDFEDSNFLVFDWGGGTLDITVTKIKNQRVYELATSGLRDIAG